MCFSCKSKNIAYDNSVKEAINKYKIKYLVYSDETIYSFKHYKSGVNYGALNQAVITNEIWPLKYCSPRSLGNVNRVKERQNWHLTEKNDIDNDIVLFNKYNDYIISKLDSCLKYR